MTSPVTERVRNVMFVGNGRCYHTLDWYRSAKRICHPQRVLFATDLVDSEGHVRLLTPDDDVVGLWNIDRVLLRVQSSFGNVWRNFVKFAVLPLQALRLRRLVQQHSVQICHAHSMYYMYLCRLAGVPFVGTPQGSEVLVRPWCSAMYKCFAVQALQAARHVTVDSIAMQGAILKLCGKRAIVVQNGIDVSALRSYAGLGAARVNVASVRNIFPNYRTLDILAARDASRAKPSLIFTYSSWEEGYRAEVAQRLQPGDQNLGRVMPKERLYEIFASVVLAVSIPMSDSSPRTVYEAIFCGAAVAVTPSSWVDALPACMRRRLTIVDLDDPEWFDKALTWAAAVTMEAYRPSEAALAEFDQVESAKRIINTFYAA